MHHGPHGAMAARHRRRPTRREFGAWLAAATAGLAITAGCEVGGPWARPAKVPRIGYLGSDSRPGYERFAALERGLRELGYVDNHTVVIERRLSQDQDGRRSSGWPPSWSRCGSTSSSPRARRRLSRRRAPRAPFRSSPGGPHRSLRDLGLVENLARPGRNVTGLDVDLGLEASGSELLHQVVPAWYRVLACCAIPATRAPKNSSPRPRTQRAGSAWS